MNPSLLRYVYRPLLRLLFLLITNAPRVCCWRLDLNRGVEEVTEATFLEVVGRVCGQPEALGRAAGNFERVGPAVEALLAAACGRERSAPLAETLGHAPLLLAPLAAP